MRAIILLTILLSLSACKSTYSRSKGNNVDIHSLEIPPCYPKDLPAAAPYAAN